MTSASSASGTPSTRVEGAGTASAQSSASCEKLRAGYGGRPVSAKYRRRPEREEIRATVQRRLLHHLRSHEGRCAYDRRRLAHRRQRAEVDQLALALAGAPDVGGTHVAVDQAARVDQCQRGADTAKQGARLAPRHRGSRAQVAPIEELHRVIRPGLVDAVVVDLDDLWVRELRQRVKFAFEERDHLAAARRLLGNDELLERDASRRRRVGHPIHRGHAAATEERIDSIARADLRRMSARCDVDLRGHRQSSSEGRGPSLSKFTAFCGDRGQSPSAGGREARTTGCVEAWAGVAAANCR